MKTESEEKWIVCRVCLSTLNMAGDDFQDIFSQSASSRLDQMLHICAGIPVSADDNFPDKMCSKCVRCLQLAYKFRMTCMRSHQHIIDLLASERGGSTMNVIVYSTDQVQEMWDMEESEENKESRREEEESEQPENYEIQTKEEGDDAIVFGDLIEQTDADDILYDGTQTVIEEVESYGDYEELEVLAADLPGTSDETSPMPAETDADYTRDEADDDVANDVLSSDDEQYLPEKKYKQNLQNRARRPPTKQQAAVANASASGLLKANEKRKGRKPRGKESNYICDVCGNIYPTQARLTEHMKFHSGVKPHECEICGRGFVQNQQLVRHMNTHTGNRPYKCNFCPAAFADRSTKTKHHRIHTKERPYECDVCQKTFTYSDNLKFHKMIHTGEKPHVCDICGKGFVKAYKMRLHRVTHEKHPWKSMNQLEIKEEEITDIVIG